MLNIAGIAEGKVEMGAELSASVGTSDWYSFLLAKAVVSKLQDVKRCLLSHCATQTCSS